VKIQENSENPRRVCDIKHFLIFGCNTKSNKVVVVNQSSVKARPFVHRFTKFRLETGFSMLEAVVVVGVLLALAVGGFFAYGPITENAKRAKVKSAASEVHTGVLVASMDGDANTEPQGVIDTWNASTGKIHAEILPPTTGGTSANGDFCVQTIHVESPYITAREGACTNVTGAPAQDTDGDGIPDSIDPDIDQDGIPNADDTTPNGNGSGSGSENPPAGGGSEFQFNLARNAGIVTAFGDNRELQAGPGSYGVFAPVSIGGMFAGKAVSDVSAGSYHGCGILDGAAYCWGANWAGESGGDPNVTGKWRHSTPNPIDTTGVLAGKTLVSIAAGNEQSCAIDTDGKAYCWGAGDYGQLGNGITGIYEHGSPVAVNAPAGEKFVKITVGYEKACGLAASGSAYCWGYGYGGLGDGVNYAWRQAVPTPVKVGGILEGKKITDIDTTDYDWTHTCAIAEGKAYCWGASDYGQLGNGSAQDETINTPVAVDTSGVLAGKTLTMITVGVVHSCALDTAGQAYCWGGNEMLGNGTPPSAPGVLDASLVPVQVSMSGELAGKTVKSISAGAFNNYLVSSDNKVYSWGQAWYGSLGDGVVDSEDDVPVPMPVTTSGVLAGKEITGVSGGGFFAYVTYKP
jgi:alpha-tubulin suppressor-like RCC1 family protein/type II secretory pathway pseudopilin PulG